ncbi:YccS/YhfK family membrane protein [Flavobacterium sp. N1718]|uniref:YccS/YhfK family membrane protein n=1 Tax=Flavobacterium sp. N1718 TaxID=2986822 RepID=UPI0022251D55|nr:YccS/YhfK family membrane protein [Flavobacterium sp. N1718]
MIRKVTHFAGSTNFSNATKVTLAAVLPVLLLGHFGYTDIGFNIAIGALLTYPSDIPSNFRHKVKGVFAAAVLVAGSNLLVNLLVPYPALLYPLLAGGVFFMAMISVYGQRATMVSFSGLLAVSLAFAHVHEGWEMCVYAGLLLAGGLLYLSISLLYDVLFPHRYVQLQIAECIRLTAKYMKYRGDLWTLGADRDTILERQLHLQVELNTIHENLREILIRTRSTSGISSENRRMLLVFSSCVDILELALSTAFDHSKLHRQFGDFPKALAVYQDLAYNLASTLKKLSKSISGNRNYVSKRTLLPRLEALESVIAEYELRYGDEAREGVLMLSNMRHYAEKQIEKIKMIERTISTKTDLEVKERDRGLERMMAPEYYPWRTFRENLSFSSNFFRHSLRLTVTVMAGFVLGKLLLFEKRVLDPDDDSGHHATRLWTYQTALT